MLIRDTLEAQTKKFTGIEPQMGLSLEAKTKNFTIIESPTVMPNGMNGITGARS